MRGYIVPREKPEHCARCPYIDAESLDCTLMENASAYTLLPAQYRHCPLIPVEYEVYPPVDIASTGPEVAIPLELMGKLLRGEETE